MVSDAVLYATVGATTGALATYFFLRPSVRSRAGQKPKLVYFNVPGRVCGLRIMMFHIYGKDGWVDERVEFKDWPSVKPTMPLQMMPLLTLPDGSRVHQTEAMDRWAGKMAALYPRASYAIDFGLSEWPEDVVASDGMCEGVVATYQTYREWRMQVPNQETGPGTSG